ncbi:MAG: Branched-chain-amino-acid transaminase [Bacilli bacterium]|nr:Branched-chain-amino-acid transaminase [Bacilli bacterium]
MNKNRNWIIRPALNGDVHLVVEGIRMLIAELKEKRNTTLPSTAGDVFHKIINKTIPGTVLIAETTNPEKFVGCVTVSVQEAIHKGGPYALIQELWVQPTYRSLSIGAQLILSVEQFCLEHDIEHIEVCLPNISFTRFNQTHKFYQNAGFNDYGPYMWKRIKSFYIDSTINETE